MSLTEGWFWPWASTRVHYVREGASLCGHWRVETPLYGQGDHLGNRCFSCRRALEREKAGLPAVEFPRCVICQRALPQKRRHLETCRAACERVRLVNVREDARDQARR